MLSAPLRKTPIEYYGWQASASAGGKVWAVYRHPQTQRTYTLHGQLKPELAGLKCTLYQKGKVLSDEDMDKLIASKQKGGYSSHNKGADQLAEGLAAAGFDVPGKRAATKSTAKKSTAKKSTAKKSTAKKRSAKKSSAKKRSAKKSTAKKRSAKKSTAKKRSVKKSSRPKTAPRQLVRVKKSIYLYKDSGVLKPAWDHIYKRVDVIPDVIPGHNITFVIRRRGKASDSPIVK